ncbi:MAG TPA: hypothetical protein VHA05_01835 [Candidatus Saccharimonadales bacterium]|nr:hypothetical protein [Candidatus Saccharimonadales bacterium]
MSADKRIGPRDLGIKLHDKSGRDHFKWLLACQLFGAPISQEVAANTYRLLDKKGFTTPDKLARADWQELVDLLDEGGYRRYDESTARELISIGKVTKEKYGGSFKEFLDEARSRAETRRKVQQFKGVGPTAADIFMREAKL